VDNDSSQSGALHRIGGSTRGLIQGIRSALRYFGPDPFTSPAVLDGELREVFSVPIERLRDSLERFLASYIESAGRERTLSAMRRLAEAQEILSGVGDITTAYELGKLRRATEIIARSLEALTGSGRPRYSKTLRKLLSENAHEIHRLLALLSFHRVLVHADGLLEELYAAIRREPTPPFALNRLEYANLSKCFEVARQELQSQLDARSIDLHVGGLRSGSYVRGSESDLINTLRHLLDNAIKYTGTLSPRSPHTGTWIGIRFRFQDRIVQVEIESWGCPMTQEELTEELPFRVYRGRFAKQRGIEGSGKGLHEVRQHMSMIGGTAKLVSPPVEKNASSTTQTTTKVVLDLPRIFPGEGDGLLQEEKEG
jgi:signal transduction histidine kinase